MKTNNVTSAAQTNPGRRSNNQDSYLEDPQHGLWLVADGMGGAAAGEIASRVVVDSVRDACARGVKLVTAIEEAHQRVRESHERGIGSPSMGSTVVAARIDGSAYEVAWVGDSRAYFWDGGVRLLTHDHSLVQRKIDEGILTPEQARVSPERNIITQCLGGSFESKLEVDTVTGHLFEGERLILCSDGMMRDMSDERLADVLNRHAGLADNALAAALVDAAGGTSASDNVTVVVISQHGFPRSAHGRVPFLLGIGITLAIIATLAYLGFEGDAPWREAILKWFGAK